MNQVLTPDGFLQEKLELKDSQSGFVGTTGEILTIEPAGAWQLAKFVNQQVEQPYRQGQLTSDALMQLANLIISNNFFSLPQTLVDKASVNPHRFMLTFGAKTSTLSRPAGQPLVADTSPDDSIQARFIEIVKGLQTLVDEKQEH